MKKWNEIFINEREKVREREEAGVPMLDPVQLYLLGTVLQSPVIGL